MKPIVITGPNASGKTSMVEKLLRKFQSEHSGNYVRYLSFRDSYGASDRGYYLQQRWNSSEYDLVPTVSESVGTFRHTPLTDKLFSIFRLDEMMDKPIIQLSCGELRKFQLAKALLCSPSALVIDNPFIGLDSTSVDTLNMLFRELCTLDELQLYLVITREADIPDYAGEIIRVPDNASAASGRISAEEACRRVSALGGTNPEYENAVVLRNVSIRFGERTILEHLDWVMKAGEKWALEGPNGSGKSTLLSIICADIPQAYACDVTLFDRRRGSGESIWDIKKHIGYVSPELHRAYCRGVPALDIVASGLHDRQGLYVKTDDDMIPQCILWMEVFGISSLKDRLFTELSSGEQRLVLLARAFVKDPDLLILDEPLHGLDERNGARVKSIIETFCSRKGKSMIMVSHYREDFPTCITNHLQLDRESIPDRRYESRVPDFPDGLPSGHCSAYQANRPSGDNWSRHHLPIP